MLNFKALGMSLLVSVFLAVPFYFYWDYLTRGMRPPQSTLMLNQMEQKGVPDFTLQDLNGKSVSLSQFKGKVVLVNFWATWCAPCVKEFPSLQNLVKLFKGDVVVLAVSYDRQKEDIDSFIKAFGGVPEHFLILWDKDKTTSSLYGTDVLPETFILDQNQKLLRKIAGEALWDEPMALRFFTDITKLGGVEEGRNPEAPKAEARPESPAAKRRGSIKTH